jgi:hypothetical protein
MPHLVAAITNCSLSECCVRLTHAHGYLAKYGADAIRRAAATAPGLSWGSSIKRERVVLRQSNDQPNVAPRGEAHNLVEVINQCATMERLIDALDWLQADESGMRYYILFCLGQERSGHTLRCRMLSVTMIATVKKRKTWLVSASRLFLEQPLGRMVAASWLCLIISQLCYIRAASLGDVYSTTLRSRSAAQHGFLRCSS